MSFAHPLDKRGSTSEGQLAEDLYKKCHKKGLKEATNEQDKRGVDCFKNGKKIDIKARKKRLPEPHTCWIEISMNGGEIGTGWAYKDKYIAQMMVYEKDNKIDKVIFGEYYAPDLINVLDKKVDWNSNLTNRGEIYKLYSRYNKLGKIERMTILTYKDLESLPSFQVIEIPK